MIAEVQLYVRRTYRALTLSMEVLEIFAVLINYFPPIVFSENELKRLICFLRNTMAPYKLQMTKLLGRVISLLCVVLRLRRSRVFSRALRTLWLLGDNGMK